MAILLKRRHLFQTIVFGYPSFFFSGVYLYSRNPVTWLKTTICIEFLNVIPWGFVTSWPGWFLQKSGWTPAQQNSFFFFIFHRPWTKDPGRWTNQYGSWFMECQGFSFGSCSHCQEQTSLACAGGLSKDVNCNWRIPSSLSMGCFFFRNWVKTCVQNRQATSVGNSNY